MAQITQIKRRQNADNVENQSSAPKKAKIATGLTDASVEVDEAASAQHVDSNFQS